VLFLAGLTFIIGLRRTAGFFFQRQKLRGSTFFLGGVALVLFRWPIIGMAVESYGFVILPCGMWIHFIVGEYPLSQCVVQQLPRK
ncbi:unnamed protein product, partial [Coregonus sp. 'balchen']